MQRKVFSVKQIASLANEMDKPGNAKGGKECWSKDNSRIGSNSGRVKPGGGFRGGRETQWWYERQKQGKRRERKRKNSV